MTDEEIELIEAISQVSEDFWAASWLDLIEWTLFRVVFLDGADIENGYLMTLDEKTKQQLRLLAEGAGGWPRHREMRELSEDEARLWSGQGSLDNDLYFTIWFEFHPLEWYENRIMEEIL